MWTFDVDTAMQSAVSMASPSPIFSPKQEVVPAPAPTQRQMWPSTPTPTPASAPTPTHTSPSYHVEPTPFAPSQSPLTYGPVRPPPRAPLSPLSSSSSLSPSPPRNNGALGPTSPASSLDADAKSTREVMEAMDALESVDERRHRRNEKERLRVRGVKDRLETLRHDLAQLQRTHENLQRELQRRACALDCRQRHANGSCPSHDPAQMDIASGTENVNVALVRRYLELMNETKALQHTKLVMEEQMRPRDLRTTALRTMLQLETESHLNVPPLPSPPHSLVGHSAQEFGLGVSVSAMALFEHVLFSGPMNPEDALTMVRDTCVEMMELLDRVDWEDNGEAFGWQCGRRVQGSRLQFKLSQVFPNVGARELMQKTWRLMTNMDDYKRIQPDLVEHKVLQRVNDECWLVGITIQGTPMRHAVLLVARALIHGGYLITFRSVPVSAARRQFLEMETGGMLVNIFSWYNFQERASISAPGGTECEVIFGGNAQNGDMQFLLRLKLMLLVGITRWQSAVDLAPFRIPGLLMDDASTTPATTTAATPNWTGR